MKFSIDANKFKLPKVITLKTTIILMLLEALVLLLIPVFVCQFTYLPFFENSESGYSFRAGLHSLLKDKKGAMRDLDKLLELNPNDVDALKWKTYILAHDGISSMKLEYRIKTLEQLFNDYGEIIKLENNKHKNIIDSENKSYKETIEYCIKARSEIATEIKKLNEAVYSEPLSPTNLPERCKTFDWIFIPVVGN